MIKVTLLSILGAFLLFVIVGLLFVWLSPQFGGSPSESQKKHFKSEHYIKGSFFNIETTHIEYNFNTITKMLNEVFNPHPNVSPKENIDVLKITKDDILNKPDSLTRITWFGHSTFLLELDGKNILVDPVFGKYAAPHSLLGRERYNNEMPIDIENLPQIDMILISHDHYDHLDYPSIMKLKEKTSQFIVPLGVGSHLESWGISTDKIKEKDWWQETNLLGLTFIFAPARHFSGRGLTDKDATLWGSWIIRGKDKNIYFSGDGGYGNHFKEIGEKYGPFDLAMMECGQYNKLWSEIHMMPEETVQAGLDVKANYILPVHWGAFALATHSWTDPIERVTNEAKKQKLPITTPRIGESILIEKNVFPNSEWWKNIK